MDNENIEKLAENKLFLLYIIDRLNFPVSNTQLIELATEMREINYFFIQQHLSELVDSGFLKCEMRDRKRMYSITPAGRQALDYFKHIIFYSLRNKINKVISGMKHDIYSKTKVFSDYTPLNEDEFVVNCRALEEETPLIEINMYAGTRKMAKKICNNWAENAAKIYPEITKLLLGHDA